MPTTTAELAALAPREAYERDGYVVLRSLLAPEAIERASLEADELLQRYQHLSSVRNLRCRWRTNVNTGDCEFETFDPVIDLSPACADLAHDARLLHALAGLYGEPACLFKDKLIYKTPGMQGYELHQDWIAWPGFPRSFLTVLIPFDHASGDNGATEVFPGYHHDGSLSAEDGQYHALTADAVDAARGVLMDLQPGDVGIFGGFTPHRSAPNRSGRRRRQLYLSYNKLSDGGAQRDKHYQEFHVWLRQKYAEHGKPDVYVE